MVRGDESSSIERTTTIPTTIIPNYSPEPTKLKKEEEEKGLKSDNQNSKDEKNAEANNSIKDQIKKDVEQSIQNEKSLLKNQPPKTEVKQLDRNDSIQKALKKSNNIEEQSKPKEIQIQKPDVQKLKKDLESRNDPIKTTTQSPKNNDKTSQ